MLHQKNTILRILANVACGKETFTKTADAYKELRWKMVQKLFYPLLLHFSLPLHDSIKVLEVFFLVYGNFECFYYPLFFSSALLFIFLLLFCSFSDCCSFDVRDKMNSDQARHWSAPEVFGSRAKFHFDSQPATLEIKVSTKIPFLSTVTQHQQYTIIRAFKHLIATFSTSN